jgi:hypothetical protein
MPVHSYQADRLRTHLRAHAEFLSQRIDSKAATHLGCGVPLPQCAQGLLTRYDAEFRIPLHRLFSPGTKQWAHNIFM